MGLNQHKGLSGNFLTRYAQRTMGDLLPSRIKRMLYIGSALGALLKSKNPDKELLYKLNGPLKLASDPASMLFPAYIWDKIWTDSVKRACDRDLLTLSDMERWKLGLVFASRCPEWLQYGTEQLMASDIYDTLRTLVNIEQYKHHPVVQ